MAFWSCTMTKADGTETPLGNWRGDTPLEAARATKKSNSHDDTIVMIIVRGTGGNSNIEESYQFDDL